MNDLVNFFVRVVLIDALLLECVKNEEPSKGSYSKAINGLSCQIIVNLLIISFG